jgi:hypothetical protein
MKALAGEPEVCKTSPRVATRRGLPLIIPGALRLKMERRDIPVIQLVLSILTVYRVLKIPPILKLNTITDVFCGNSRELPSFEIRQVLREFKANYLFKIDNCAELLPSISAGPNNRIAVLAAPIDA